MEFPNFVRNSLPTLAATHVLIQRFHLLHRLLLHPCPDIGVLLSDNVAVPIVPTMFHPDAKSGSALLIAPVLVARITRMNAVVSVSPIARVCGVQCTVGEPLFVLMSVALLLPVLLVCSELVLNIAIITSVFAVRPGVSLLRDNQGFVCAGCSRAVNLFMLNAEVGIGRFTVPVLIAFSVRPLTGWGRDSGERRTREPL